MLLGVNYSLLGRSWGPKRWKRKLQKLGRSGKLGWRVCLPVYFFVQSRSKLNLICNIHTEMTPDQRRALEALRDLPMAGDDDDEIDLGRVTIEDILDGSEPLNISHAGGELAALAEELKEGLQHL
jgi:hypothetical protein